MEESAKNKEQHDTLLAEEAQRMATQHYSPRRKNRKERLTQNMFQVEGQYFEKPRNTMQYQSIMAAGDQLNKDSIPENLLEKTGVSNQDT